MRTLMKYWGILTIFSTMESSKLINCRDMKWLIHKGLIGGKVDILGWTS